MLEEQIQGQPHRRLISGCLAAISEALEVFRPSRKVRKTRVFGSARTQPEEPYDPMELLFELHSNPLVIGRSGLVLFFRYFLTRKLVFLRQSDAVVVIPGIPPGASPR